MNEKTAKHLKGASSMAEAWTMLDDVYYVAKGLMVEFQGLTAIKKRHFERQHDHYFLIQYSISAADEARQGHLLLVFANIEEMMRALPQREKTLWWDAWGHMGSRDLGSTFSAFIEERLDWSLAQMTGAGTGGAKPTPAPIKNHRQDDGAGYSKTATRWASGTPERCDPRPRGTRCGQGDTQEGGTPPPPSTSETSLQDAC
jgi:hypothetical protein